MDTSLIMVGFVGAIALFTFGLAVLLHDEHRRRTEHEQLIAESVQSSRRATMVARVASVAPVESIPVVRPGSFCRVPGTMGRSRQGTLLVCSSVPEARPRWREARRLSRAS